jgi:hypothetical protein
VPGGGGDRSYYFSDCQVYKTLIKIPRKDHDSKTTKSLSQRSMSKNHRQRLFNRILIFKGNACEVLERAVGISLSKANR